MQPPGRSGNLRTARLPVSYEYMCPAEHEVVALSAAELKAPQHGCAMSHGNGEGRATSYQAEKQNKDRPLPVFGDVFMVGANYSSMHTAGGPSETAAGYGQLHNENADSLHRRSDSRLLVRKAVRSFPRESVLRTKVSFASSRQAAAISASEHESNREPSDEAADYGKHNQLPLHQFKQHNWNQHDDAPQEDELACSNGQSDGDASSNCVGGGVEGGPPEDADEVLREQEEVFDLLLKADECHEKWLATQRMLQERGVNTSCRPPENDSPKKGSGGMGPCSLSAGSIDHRKKAKKKQRQKSGSNTATDHWKLQGNPQHTGASFSPLNQEQSLYRNHCEKIMETPGPSSCQIIIKLPSIDYYVHSVGAKVPSVNDHQLWAPRHGDAVCRGGDGNCSSSHQRPKRKQSKNRPAATSANGFLAGTCDCSAMYPEGGPAATAAVYWKHDNENAHVVLRRPDTEPLVLEPACSFAPRLEARTKVPFAPSRQVPVISIHEDSGSREARDHASSCGQKNLLPLQQLQQHKCDQSDELLYDDKVPGSNGQNDRDALSTCCGEGAEGGAREDTDELVKRQAKVFALKEMDEGHENRIASENVLWDRDASTSRRAAGDDSLAKRNGGDSSFLSSETSYDEKSEAKKSQNASGSNIFPDSRKLEASACRTKFQCSQPSTELCPARSRRKRSVQRQVLCGSQWTMKLPTREYYVYSARPKAAAESDAEMKVPRRGNTACRSGGGRRAPSHQQQQHRQQHVNGPASAFADVFVAGACYSSTMHTAVGLAATGEVYWQNRSEDAVIVHRSCANEPLGTKMAQSFAPAARGAPRAAVPID